MDFVQKVYWEDKPLILTGNRDAFIQKHPEAAAYPAFTGASAEHYHLALQQMEQNDTQGAIITDNSPALLQETLQHLYQPVTAGGGIVLNEAGQVLLIYRRGKWDLPKGKQDEGEDIVTCALREVKEETGLQEVRIERKAGETWHIYAQDGKKLLKHTTWFLMHANGAEQLTPQQEEDIEAARWVDRNALTPFIKQAYKAVHEILQKTIPGELSL